MTACKLYIRGDHWRLLSDHLYGSPGEHGAVLLCGTAPGMGHQRLLVHEVHIAEDEVDYTYAQGVYTLAASFASRLALRARSEQLVYIGVHPHGGHDRVGFSGVDLRSQYRSTKPLLVASGNQRVGWLVTAPAAATGVIRSRSSEVPIIEIVIHDDERRITRTPAPGSVSDTSALRFARQSLIYGEAGQALFAGCTVGIIGLGGGGSLVNDMLSSLGVGHLVHVDPETIDVTNLPRLVGATRWDALEPIAGLISAGTRNRFARSKVAVARRVARRNNPGMRVTTIRRDIGHRDAIEALIRCDYLFLAADTARARLIANAIATQYLIPMTQIGAKVRVDDDGAVRDIYSVSRIVGRLGGCLWCNGLIDSTRLAEEAVTAEQRANQRYVAGVANPSVKSLNAIGVAWAVEDFRNWYTGVGSAGQLYTVARPRPARLISSIPRNDAACPFCARALGRGETDQLAGAS